MYSGNWYSWFPVEESFLLDVGIVHQQQHYLCIIIILSIYYIFTIFAPHSGA